MITGEKNRAQNCPTVSNLKLDEVFSDVLGKSSRSITEHIFQHPGEIFDVKPFVDRRCKTPIEEIQAAVDGAISPEQSVILHQCLKHIDEFALIKSKKHPEFISRYRRIKARRGHKKAIIAICRMILTAIWHLLTDLNHIQYNAK